MEWTRCRLRFEASCLVIGRQRLHNLASVPSYETIGVELGRHFIWNVEGRPIDLGFFSLGFYSYIGNHYSSGHFKIGSGWRF